MTTLDKDGNELANIVRREPSTQISPPGSSAQSEVAVSDETGERFTDSCNQLKPAQEKSKDDGQNTASDQTDEEGYLKGWRLAIMIVAPCLTMFAVALDNTIISTAIPTITAEFKTIADIGWYGAAYLLTAASMQILYGKIYTFNPLKWVTLAALGLFELGSLVCAVTTSSLTLIIGRALAGLGSAGLLSAAVLIAGQIVPLRQRPMLVGLVSGLNGLASIAGPLLGGLFTAHLSWRWCFYINLPIGGTAALIILFLFEPSGKGSQSRQSFKQQIPQLDLLGTALFIPSIICLLLALEWGGTAWAWSNVRIIVLFILFGVLSISFVAIQIRKGETALVPPRLLKNRNVWSGGLCMALAVGAFYIIVYYLPLWFQVIKDVSAFQSGIMFLPMLVSMIVMSVVSGGLVSQIGYYTPFLMAGLALLALGAGLMSTFQPDTASPKWIGYQIIFGAALGCAVQQPLLAMQASLPKPDIPIGTAIMFFSQTLGGTIFLSIAQTVFDTLLMTGITAADIPGLTAATVNSVGATEIRKLVAAQYLPVLLTAYNNAITHTFYIAVGVACLAFIASLFVEWNSVKGKDLIGAPA
ncbi:hypothetical protein CFD26_108157 [Aspergillus turcosus]|uniref:Major facilitator superfamily (MFS) profile domain-containing protein n=1 Tax=Aspergillus turcosus TaxID=1245748 RepID=A0A421DER8_9EURO|nr:hypothetical protein CFD26_108157 [Aspergillus turcosus]